jgi:multisubunit Na+/H+ antiporter MnhB subunit
MIDWIIISVAFLILFIAFGVLNVRKNNYKRVWLSAMGICLCSWSLVAAGVTYLII